MRHVARILALLFALSFLRWNATPSMPRGLYLLVPFPPTMGEMVMACPPPENACLAVERDYVTRGGPCACNSALLLKYVAGAPGDRITLDRTGVRINGTPLPRSAPLDADSRGRSITWATRDLQLSPHHFWLTGLDARSWDSRYFGSIPASSIHGVVRPLWVRR
ncbi:MAG TPA: conjugative transfer signal peptidase TraF [Thermoanaerobaculia bacterium]|jgi:conjugative transfer signal peptidase TraF|nr:conjugative transfer signal peptidase TraF [Thermoanaerobaculia bacterium]